MSKTYIDANGYLRFNGSGLLVSRWVASRMLGRPLYPHEVVHHIDGNKLNNNEWNLQVLTRAQHHQLHQQGK